MRAVGRELEEELEIFIQDFEELGSFSYKGAQHMVYGAELDRRITYYDDSELLDMKWFNLTAVRTLHATKKLHAGYELEAIELFRRNT